MSELRPVSELNTSNIKGVFFDIDDTFSTNGKITNEAYSALWNLKNSGLIVVPITGRPAGWCDHIARMWPVTAVVGENGAFYFMMKDGKLQKKYIQDRNVIEKNKVIFKRIEDEVFKKYPNAALASDQSYREFDLAIDFCEDVPRMSNDEINGMVEIFERHGATTKVSSIHINGWFGDYDKQSATKVFAKQELGVDLDDQNEMFVFAGDSQNDEPMFKYFQNSVGVNNVLDFKDRLKFMPKYITKGKSGIGFSELAMHLVK